MTIGQVYMITNKLNGMWYIGSHAGDIFVDDYWGSGKIIKQAVKKNGKHNFLRQVIDESVYFREMEEFYLKSLNAASNPKSYNLKEKCIGNDKGCIPWNKGLVNTKQKGIKQSEEHKRNRSLALKGKPNLFAKGKKRPSEVIKKMLDTKKKNGTLGCKLGEKRGPYELKTCPHCDKLVSGGNLVRWHLDNCKEKK